MYGIFINDHSFPYTQEILLQHKTIETRTRNTLKKLIGKRVAIIRTGKGKPQIVGYVTIAKAAFCPADLFDSFRNKTLIPCGDPYDSKAGKWFYYLENAEKCTPYPIPENAVRHGRVWVEF